MSYFWVNWRKNECFRKRTSGKCSALPQKRRVNTCKALLTFTSVGWVEFEFALDVLTWGCPGPPGLAELFEPIIKGKLFAALLGPFCRGLLLPRGPPAELTEGPPGPVLGPPTWPGPPGRFGPPARPLWSGCFKGWQTGQSFRVQLFQWQIICLDEEQWGTGHDFPDWHDVIWVSTFFIVRQWGKWH